MSDPVDALIVDLLEWIGPQGRPYAEVIDAWRTSCPRLPVWEEANARGYIVHEHRAVLFPRRTFRRHHELHHAVDRLHLGKKHLQLAFGEAMALYQVRDERLHLGAKALQEERTADAVTEFDEVLKVDPNDDLAKRSRELALRYDKQTKDLLYKIYVKYLPLRQAS